PRRSQGRRGARVLPAEVAVQPGPDLPEHRRLPLRSPGGQTRAEVLLSVEPQPGEGSVLPRPGDRTQGGAVPSHIGHSSPPSAPRQGAATQGGVAPSHIDHSLPPAAPRVPALPAVLLVPSSGGGPLPGAGAPAVAGAFALCRARFLHPTRPAAGAGGGFFPV